MTQRLLRDVVIVQPSITFERLLQVVTGMIASNCQYIADAAVKALHHAVCLWPSRFDQAVFNPMRQAFLIEEVAATGRALPCPRKAIREGLSIVGEHRPNLEGAFPFTRFMNALASLADWLRLTSR